MPQIRASAGNQSSTVQINRPAWQDMIDNYPNENTKSIDFYPMISQSYLRLATGEDSHSWENTCAARMSYALNRSGIRLAQASNGGSLKGNDGFNYWIRVKDLKAYLKQRLGKPDIEHSPIKITEPTREQAYQRADDVRNNMLNQIQGKHGIVVFDVTGWSNASGHFTLWDGKDLVYVGPGEHNDTGSLDYYFWFMRHVGNNKFHQTTHISFWELK